MSDRCCGTVAVEIEQFAAPQQAASGQPGNLPVVVIGAGPVGLAAAAHLAERGIDFRVLEAGDRVAASVAQWGHVRVFSPWKYNIDAAARRLLEADGWTAPDADWLPTGAELIDDYLAPPGKQRGLDPGMAEQLSNFRWILPHFGEEVEGHGLHVRWHAQMQFAARL